MTEPTRIAEYVVGFTGTREGMTDDQRGTVMAILDDLKIVEAHHGDCLGSDAQFDALCREQGGIVIIVHPPTNPVLRAFCESAVEWPEKSYCARNRDIVDVSDMLIATPKSRAMTGGGTWYTIHYAQGRHKKVVTVWPDGTTRIDGEVDRG